MQARQVLNGLGVGVEGVVSHLRSGRLRGKEHARIEPTGQPSAGGAADSSMAAFDCRQGG
ncbi:hypothetical protein XAC1083_760050 [Xanthomonas citri pv. citri]|nr:hypothetical protein XAC1083_760050 [Xanthomonas citri pv. citri]